MFNKALIGVCIILLPIAIMGSYRFAKTQMAKPKPNTYDTLVDNQPQPVTPDPLNPNSKAEVLIDAPITAKCGQLVRFDLSKSSGSMFAWKVIPTSTNFEVYESGRKAVFSAEASGDYTFIVAAALNGTVDVKTHTVKVGTVTPPPTPPQPPPPPPVTPTSTVAAKITAWADAVTTPTKKAESLKLATSFDTVSAMIVAKSLTTPEDIIAKTAELNRSAMGTSLPAWVPFLTNLQTEMKTRAEAGTLTTVEQHSQLWREIANALKSYGSN